MVNKLLGHGVLCNEELMRRTNDTETVWGLPTTDISNSDNNAINYACVAQGLPI